MNVIQEVVSSLGLYQIHGTFKWKERTLANPIVDKLPSELKIDGDDDMSKCFGVGGNCKARNVKHHGSASSGTMNRIHYDIMIYTCICT